MNKYINSQPYVGVYKQSVEPFSEDATGHISIRNLGTKLISVACQHAATHHFGYDDLQKENLVWVLSRITFHFIERPKVNEEYNIITWVENVYKRFTNRNYQLTNAEGHIIAEISSVWSVINFDSRQSVDLTTLCGKGFQSTIVEKPLTLSFPHLRRRLKDVSPATERTIIFSDLDINQHVNSMRYIEMILDLFSLDFFKNHDIEYLDIQYSQEAYFGDHITLFAKEMEENDYHIEIHKKDTTLARAQLKFKS